MQPDSRIFIAGHNGLVGSAILRSLRDAGYKNLIVKSRSELDLSDSRQVLTFFEQYRPEFVFLAAAKVGGILANSKFPADFILENIKIQSNVITSAFETGTKKLLFLGSSCIYPKLAVQPIKESELLTGPLEPTNLPYAVAKIAGKVMCDSFREQYGFNAFTVMPSNVYGAGDNFHPENSHVVAGLMRRIHDAKTNRLPSVSVWGSGKPLRELIYVDDLALACVHLMNTHEDGGMVNSGTSEEFSIKEIAERIKSEIGYEGILKFDASKPDGTPRKIMDNSILFSSGWRPKVSLEKGIAMMYQYFLDTHV